MRQTQGRSVTLITHLLTCIYQVDRSCMVWKLSLGAFWLYSLIHRYSLSGRMLAFNTLPRWSYITLAVSSLKLSLLNTIGLSTQSCKLSFLKAIIQCRQSLIFNLLVIIRIVLALNVFRPQLLKTEWKLLEVFRHLLRGKAYWLVLYRLVAK